MANYKNSYKVQEKELVSLSVYNVGFQKCDPLYQWGPGIRNHYLIHYIISGKGYYEVNGKMFSLQAGDTFLVYPNTEVTYYADQNTPWEYTWVGFTGSDAAKIKRQLLRIYEARGNEFQNAVEMTGRLYTALALFMKHSPPTEQQDSAKSYVQKGIEFISANYSYPITVEDIADYVGVSRSHLFRSFESVLQQSPKEYLTSFRMKQACYLLEHSTLSITAIANSVGFENSLYFSKSFRKMKGLSPRSYRQDYMHLSDVALPAHAQK